jgi:hypothetical protein
MTKTQTRNKKMILLAIVIAALALTMIFAVPTMVTNAADTGVELTNLNADGSPIRGDVYKGSPADEQIDVQVRQDGTETSFSTDGGKTWSDTMPADSGMTLNVEEQ